MIHLSIITPTAHRPRFLANILGAVRRQEIAGVRAEHLVISDGPDPFAKRLCQAHGATYLELATRAKDLGASPRNLGTQEAKGEYVCFWDDDNYYEPHAAASLLACAWGADIGCCKVRQYEEKRSVAIPLKENGTFTFGDIDTACFCLKRELALTQDWRQWLKEGQDWYFISQIQKKNPELVIRYCPIEIATHVPGRMG